MKKFNKEAIEGARQFFREDGFEEVEANVGRYNFSYFVMPQDCEPNLRGFAMRMTGEPEDGYVLGVCESVPERFRPYWAVHELIEFTEIEIDTPGRCAKALEKELELVPEDMKPEYIPRRIAFFRALIEYCSAQPENYTPDDIEEFKGTLARLEELRI